MSGGEQSEVQRALGRSLDALLIVSATLIGLSVVFLIDRRNYEQPLLLGIGWICLGLALIVGLVARSLLMRSAVSRSDLYLVAEAPYAFLLVGVTLLIAFGWLNVGVT